MGIKFNNIGNQYKLSGNLPVSQSDTEVLYPRESDLIGEGGCYSQIANETQLL